MSALKGVPPPLLRPGVLTGGAPKADLAIAIVLLLLIIPVVVVGLRIYVRLRIVKIFGRDDFFIILAMLFMIGISIAICFEAKLGSPLGLLGLGPGALKAVLAFHLLYFVAVWAVKMSILSFCYNIFGRSVNSRIKLVVWAIMALVTTHFVIAFATTLFACSPISNAWDPTHLFESCFNFAAMQIAHAVINTCTDTMVFALPIALLTRTKIDPEKKSVVIGIFTLGSFAILASIARIFSSVILATTLDQPSNWILLPLFTALEVNMAITSASLPALSPLIRSALRRVAKHSGGNGWLSRFDEPSGHDLSSTAKPFGSLDQATSPVDGGIRIKHEFSLEESESAFEKTESYTTVRSASPYHRQEPAMIYEAARPPPANVRPARLHAREATYGAGDMSLAEMLRTTGPGDDGKWARGRGGGGKAREILGV